MTLINILLVDDEPDGRSLIAQFLSDCGHLVIEADNAYTALSSISENEIHLVLSDNKMPGISGIDLLRRIKDWPGGEDIDVVIFTAFSDQQVIIDALRAGAYDYLPKPINIEELVAITERVAEHLSLKTENRLLTARFSDALEAAVAEAKEELSSIKLAYSKKMGLKEIGIFSPVMQQIIDVAGRLHDNRSIPVLIEGETGTGKEIIARFIHHGNDLSDAPFIALNCAAIAPSVFESELFGYESGSFTGALSKGQKGKLDLAQGGTLFLDEISEIPVSLQAKLLRFIEEKEFYRVGGLKKIKSDVRIIGASNQDLGEMLRQGTFRQDLYYRLNTCHINVPPLRERKDEIIPLANMFLKELAYDMNKSFKSISKDAANILLDHDWPGNVRELRHVLEWSVMMFNDIKLKSDHLNIVQRSRSLEKKTDNIIAVDQLDLVLPPHQLPLDHLLKQIYKAALDMHKGNKTETARYLGISRSSLHYRLKTLD